MTDEEMARERNEAHAQAAVMREALEGLEAWDFVRAARAHGAGRALLAELAAHRSRATGLCSAHQTAIDPSCLVCYPDTSKELAALRALLELAKNEVHGHEACQRWPQSACTLCRAINQVDAATSSQPAKIEP